MSPGRIKSATVVEKMRTYVDHVVGHVGGVGAFLSHAVLSISVGPSWWIQFRLRVFARALVISAKLC